MKAGAARGTHYESPCSKGHLRNQELESQRDCGDGTKDKGGNDNAVIGVVRFGPFLSTREERKEEDAHSVSQPAVPFQGQPVGYDHARLGL